MVPPEPAPTRMAAPPLPPIDLSQPLGGYSIAQLAAQAVAGTPVFTPGQFAPGYVPPAGPATNIYPTTEVGWSEFRSNRLETRLGM